MQISFPFSNICCCTPAKIAFSGSNYASSALLSFMFAFNKIFKTKSKGFGTLNHKKYSGQARLGGKETNIVLAKWLFHNITTGLTICNMTQFFKPRIPAQQDLFSKLQTLSDKIANHSSFFTLIFSPFTRMYPFSRYFYPTKKHLKPQHSSEGNLFLIKTCWGGGYVLTKTCPI